VSGVFRVYEHVGKDGYPPEWHKLPSTHGTWPGIKDIVREQAGHRCVRCLHPYRKGEHGKGEWTPCDAQCRHVGTTRPAPETSYGIEAHWRILTVHHLNGDKADCRWWNLAALCQRCHLTIQGRVLMERVYPLEHSDWFKPYAAGWYAHAYLGEELTREQVDARLEELLALERAA
jgi:hypothetical protein